MVPDLSSLIDVSARIGADPLLVQGPGGNTSLKVGGEIWVKASGTWLAEAADRSIFVGLSLSEAITRLAENLEADLSGARVAASSDLRPSIETALHVLMPHAAVLHAHAIGAMTLSILADGQARAVQALAGLNWAWAPYRRPGAPLAEEIRRVLQAGAADILILQNHGVVVGGDTPQEAEALLTEVERRLSFPVRGLDSANAAQSHPAPGFDPLPQLSGLAIDLRACEIVTQSPLFPDQVVFLGGALPTVRIGESLADTAARTERDTGVAPAFLLVPDVGVFGRVGRSAAAESVMQGLYEVARRVPAEAVVRGLPEGAIGALLGWDAETYRLGLAQDRTA